MLDIIADIRSRLGTCNQRDADTATLLGIVDTYTDQLQAAQAENVRLRVALEKAEILYRLGQTVGYHSTRTGMRLPDADLAEQIIREIKQALSTPPKEGGRE